MTLGAPGAMPGSAIGSGAFDGTTSFLRLPDRVIGTKRHLAAELWFKTSSTAGGVLLGTTGQAQPNTTPTGGSAPILYVGTDGKLYGHFWNDVVAGISTAAPVNDGKWHHVVLSGALDTQTLYLDGQAVGSQSGRIAHVDAYTHIGAGLMTSRGWPARPADDWGHFNGTISDVAIYDRPLSAGTVTEHWNATAASQVLAKITLPGGRVAAQIAYDNATDRARMHVDANGGTWTLAPLTLVSKTQTVATMTNPVGQATTQTFDPSRGGRLTSITRPGNATKTFGYDTGGFLNKTVNANNVLETFVNDARGNRLSETVGWNSTTSGKYTRYTKYYLNAADPLDPRNDRVIEHRDARSGSATNDAFLKTYSYTPSGDLAGTTLPGADATSRRSTSITYTTGAEPAVEGGTMPAGLVLTETNAGGGVTTYAYTSRGNLREITDPAGRKTVRLYDGLGRLINEKVVSSTVPNGATTTYTYDGLSRLVTRTEAAVTNAVTGVAHRKRTTNTYNPDGTTASTKIDDAALNDPGRSTSFTYDAFGRVATTTDPLGAVTRTEYDVMGQRTRLVDAAGTEFTYTYTQTLHQPATTTVKGFTGDGGEPRDVVLESRAYDPVGQLASRTDAMGRTTGYQYAFTGMLQTETLLGYKDPVTGAVKDVNLHIYRFNGAGQLTGLDTWGGIQHTKYVRDPGGRVVERRDNDNDCWPCYHTGHVRSKVYTYDSNDNITTEVTKNPVGSEVARTDYTHDALGRELTRTVHAGPSTLVTTTTRDEQGLPLTITDPRGNGHTRTFGYDNAGRLVTRTSPAVQTETNGAAPTTTFPTEKIGYNTYGEVVDSLDALGQRTRTERDAAGRPTRTTLPTYAPPSTAQPITATTATAYDSLGRVSGTTDPAGNTTDFGYDQLGNQVRRTDPLLPGQDQRGVWTATFDPTGQQLSTTDPTGAQTFATYDMLGSRITSTVVERIPAPTRNLTTRFDYDRVNRLSEVVTPDGHETKHLYDDLGNLVWTSDALGNVSTAAYDAFGRLVTATDPLGGKTTATYDPAGRLITTADVDPAGTTLRSRTFAYDDAGNRVSATDSLGKTTTWAYDALNRMRSITRPGGITTGYGYDAGGNVTRVTNGNGDSTTFTTNAWGLPESTIEPATAQTPNAVDRTFTAAYDATGRISVLTKPGGVSITNTYDPLGNLLKQTGSGASAATPDRVFGYDRTGRMTSASASDGMNTYAYDDRGNLVNAAGPSGASTFAYDNQNRLSTVSTSAGDTTYGYDAAGRLASAQDPITGSTATYTVDALGRATAIDYGTGASNRTFTYDALGHPATDVLIAPGGTVTASTGYTFDTEDRLTGKTTTGLAGAGTNTYGYDDAGRLVSWNNGSTTTDYGWDGAGNLTRDGPTTATYDQRNHLLTRGGLTNTYTARGTLASRTTDGTTVNLAFNAYDELVTDGATTNTYDAFGRLVGTGNDTLAYQGAGQTIISAGTDLYTHTPGGTPLGVKQGTTTATAVTDLHTDLVAVVDPATGEVTGSRTYGPFGAVQASAGTQPGLGYQHQWTDPATGNVNMGARWYQPGTGTFASRDTAALHPTDLLNANRHAYAAANPLTHTDPTGHYAHCAAGLAAGPGAPVAVGGCLAGSFAFLALAGAASSAGFAIPLGGTTATFHHPKINLKPKPKPSPSNSRANYPDGVKPGSGYTPPPTTPPGPSLSGHKPGSGYYTGGSTVPQPVPVPDYHAEQVLANALTPATRQALTTTIAAGVQAAIDAANTMSALDLGVIHVENSAGQQPFQPESASYGSGFTQPTLAQAYLENACYTGGLLRADVFGAVGRSAGLWGCGSSDEVAYRPGTTRPFERTYETSPGYDPDAYLEAIAKRYGINLRGAGATIKVMFDPGIPSAGATRGRDGGLLIRVGRLGLAGGDAEAANTIAHELSHARYYLRHGTFEHEVHGSEQSVADGTPFGSGNALQEWIEGRR
ncbi:RHS repeat-associated core domain-containing protein [Saccharothrix sp. NRRL B-16314]|uniref:RHS repeat-associated core domain-containing protein n=1 Tax=Saccharothrix sp. NRRL B-16314 TaxID=1463825 RepID=UPI0005254F0A|nr:LamG-like jellyroll fold domain-containing protein [Saccharothrix sp. NRRL B-16314]